MKKHLCTLLAATCMMLGSFANAAVIHFDDLNASGKLSAIAKYNPYETLAWSSGWFLGTNSVAGYGNGAHSGTQFVTNGFGVNNLGITSLEAFDFMGAWFATPNTNGAKAGWINISAYDQANQLIGSTGNIAINASFAWVGANFANVARLNIARDKGWFVMDDLSFRNASDVPEPGTAALLLLAALALGVARRKRVQ